MKLKFLTILTTLAIGASVAVAQEDASAAEKPAKKPMDPAAGFKKLDANGDGKVTLDEVKESPRGKKDAAKAEKWFNKKDTNKDGSLSLEEFSAKPAPKKEKPAAAEAEAEG